ncbi:hypothetical protein DL96DRAFT_1701753 [Flagelloscypha sp. PMI_526]|nr:hypothetical protein DL96DRAFT_1701753 [Flagelloscypha sp. PMI_526]
MREVLKEDFLEDDNPEFYFSLLDGIDGQFDKCCLCEEARGCALWNCTNWNLFFLHSGFSSDRLGEVFRQDAPVGVETFIQELYEQSEVKDWDEEDWLCAQCLILRLGETTPPDGESGAVHYGAPDVGEGKNIYIIKSFKYA